jgi:uncharacterized membrane protein YdjX (TVP38/TMEM64 family)
MTVERVSPKVPKPLVVLVFLVFWAVAIVAWCLANVSNIHQVQALIVDLGLIFAFAGFAALFVETRRGLNAILIFSLLGLVLFGVGDLLGVSVLVYSLRILGSAVAFVIVPTNALIAKLRILT